VPGLVCSLDCPVKFAPVYLGKTAAASDAEKARVALEHLEHEVAAERAVERERERVLEQEQSELMVERRRSQPTPTSTASLWPLGIRRPSRGRRW
jgi:hypothetical protein